MSGFVSVMADLLETRLGPVLGIAVLAIAGVPVLRHGLVVLERSGRIKPATTIPQRGLRTDLYYLLLSPLTDALSKTVTTFAVVACAMLLGEEIGPGALKGFGPVAEQPRWLIVIEMLVLSDFIYYWTHRMAHTVPALWRLHAVHHSSQHLRWISALRAHPAEVYLHLITAVPLFIVGFPVDGMAILAPLVTFYAFLIHTDSEIAMRKLSYVMNSPMFHGWHHALEVKNGGVNFAGFFPIFDKLFGTYRLPEERPSAVGIDDEQMPETYLAQLAYPFRRGETAATRADIGAFAHEQREPETPFVVGDFSLR